MSVVAGRNRAADAVPLDQQTQQPVTVIYFRKSSGNAMKRLATRVRDNGVQTRLVWSHKFIGPEDINNQARAVIIEEGCSGQSKIAKSYERYAHNVEIHYVNAEGQFVELSEEPGLDDALAPLSGSGAGEIDPRDAVANLRSKEEAVAEPDPVEEPDQDESSSVDTDSGEDFESEEDD